MVGALLYSRVAPFVGSLAQKVIRSATDSMPGFEDLPTDTSSAPFRILCCPRRLIHSLMRCLVDSPIDLIIALLIDLLMNSLSGPYVYYFLEISVSLVEPLIESLISSSVRFVGWSVFRTEVGTKVIGLPNR